MKKIALLAAAAVVTVAVSPAFAAGSVGFAQTYVVGGSVPAYCTLGSPSVSGTNVTISGSNSQNISINTLQAQPAGTSQSWEADLNFQNALCNTNFNVTAGSLLGGLHAATLVNPGSQFTNKQDYNVAVAFGSNTGSGLASTLGIFGKKLISNGTPANGDFGLAIAGKPGLPLVAGLYGDTLTVSMSPTL